MDISFATGDLAALCQHTHLAKRRLGSEGAKKLQRRLADLAAAMNVGELCAGRPHPLGGDRLGQFSLSIIQGIRLVFQPDDDPIPRRDDGAIDWKLVTKARILFIGDYHD